MAYQIINGVQFYYEIKGKGNPLLFIHGLGSSTLDWEKQIPFFAPTFKTIAIDFRGHGQSDSTKGDYSVKQFADDIASLLESEQKAIDIVGISMGGAVGFHLAVHYPALVKRLVIINSFAELSLDTRKKRKAVRLRKLIPRIFGMKRMGKILGKKLFQKENQEGLRKIIAERWAKNTVKDYIKSMNALIGWSILEQLPEIKCPVLVIASEFDYIDIKEKETYTKAIPNAQLQVIKDARHAVSMEKPAELNEMIFQFLK